MGLTYRVLVGVEDATGGQALTDVSRLVRGLTVDRPGVSVGRVAPVATCRFDLLDVHGLARGNGEGVIAEGAPVLVDVYGAYDDFSLPGDNPLDLDERSIGGLMWNRGSQGGPFSISHGSARAPVPAGRPTGAGAYVDAGESGLPGIGVFYRGTNGLGGYLVAGNRAGRGQRLRFTDRETLLEDSTARRPVVLARDTFLGKLDWHRVYWEWDGSSLRVWWEPFSGGDGGLLHAVGLEPAGSWMGLDSAFRNTVDRWGSFGIGRRIFTGEVQGRGWTVQGELMPVFAVDASVAWRESPAALTLSPGRTRTLSGVATALALGAGIKSWRIHVLGPRRVLRTGTPLVEVGGAWLRVLGRFAEEVGAEVWFDERGDMWVRDIAGRQAVVDAAGGDGAVRMVAAVANGLSARSNLDSSFLDGALKSLEMFYRRPVLHGDQKLWGLSGSVFVPAEASRLVQARFDEPESYYGGAPYVHTGDLVANSDEDGTGDDLAAEIAVQVLGTAAVGGDMQLLVKNGGLTDAWVSGFDVYSAKTWKVDLRATSGYRKDGGVGLDDRVVVSRFLDYMAGVRGVVDDRMALEGRRRLGYEFRYRGDGHGADLAMRVLVGTLVDVQAGWDGYVGDAFVEGYRFAPDGWTVRIREV